MCSLVIILLILLNLNLNFVLVIAVEQRAEDLKKSGSGLKADSRNFRRTDASVFDHCAVGNSAERWKISRICFAAAQVRQTSRNKPCHLPSLRLFSLCKWNAPPLPRSPKI